MRSISQSDMADIPVISLCDTIQCAKHNGNKVLKVFEDGVTKRRLQPVNVMITCKNIYMHICMDKKQ